MKGLLQTIRNIFKIEELRSRIYVTLGFIFVYRLCALVTLPGVNRDQLENFTQSSSEGLLGILNLFTGGAFSQSSIMALGIMPYISASIIMSLLTHVNPTLTQLKKEGGEIGRQKINQYTRYGTVLLATFQGYGLSVGLENMGGALGSAVIDPGFFFRISTVITIIGGTVFLLWLGEQITQRGIGNGISLIIFAGIVANLPAAVAGTFELVRTGALSPFFIIALIFFIALVFIFIVFMERAQRKIFVQYPKRQVGNKMYGGEGSHMPLKLNMSGVIPAIFASSVLLLPLTLSGLTGGRGPGLINTLSTYLSHGKPLYLILYLSLIIFFCFFYTSIVFNPQETADNLKKNGGFVPGIRPGENTAQYFDYVLTRITLVGALYLGLVCIIPELLISKFSVPFYFGGTSLLIVVVVMMATIGQIQSQQ
jgi:preprotein translocase subunit SecY